MTKVNVTLDEKKALDEFTSTKTSLEMKIGAYLRSSNNWEDCYKPLKDMGFDKFVKCLVNGYEVELDDTLKFNIKGSYGYINLSYNCCMPSLKKEIEPIYLGLTTHHNSIGLSVESTQQLIDNLTTLLQQLKLIRSDIK